MCADVEVPEGSGPLAGVRVLDLGGSAAFYCTKVLADLGADVVRIERADEPVLRRGPFLTEAKKPEESLYRWHFHANKRSLAADVATAEGRELTYRLLQVADVLVESYADEEARDLGLDEASVRRLAPRLIHASITPFGREGAFAGYVATDLVGQAMSGLMALTGFPDDPPNQLGAEQAYHQASLHAAVGILLALHAREADGVGRHVEVVLQDCTSMATLQTANLNFYLRDGTVRKRAGLGRNPLQGANPSFRSPAGP